MSERYKEMTPAGEGWRAAVVGMDHEARSYKLWSQQVAAWAHDTQLDSVVGIIVNPDRIMGMVGADELWEESNLGEVAYRVLGYLEPGEDVDLYNEEAEQVLQSWCEAQDDNMHLWNAGWFDLDDGGWEAPDGRKMSRMEALEEVKGG